MERLFYKKSVAILTVAAVVVLIFLLCMLLTMLTIFSSLGQTAEKLTTMVEQVKAEEIDKQELINYRKTDKYVIEWAIRMNLIPDDVINYIETELND